MLSWPTARPEKQGESSIAPHPQGFGLAPSRIGWGEWTGNLKGRTGRRRSGVQPDLVVRAPVKCTEQRSAGHVEIGSVAARLQAVTDPPSCE